MLKKCKISLTFTFLRKLNKIPGCRVGFYSSSLNYLSLHIILSSSRDVTLSRSVSVCKSMRLVYSCKLKQIFRARRSTSLLIQAFVGLKLGKSTESFRQLSVYPKLGVTRDHCLSSLTSRAFIYFYTDIILIEALSGLASTNKISLSICFLN